MAFPSLCRNKEALEGFSDHTLLGVEDPRLTLKSSDSKFFSLSRKAALFIVNCLLKDEAETGGRGVWSS